MDGIEHGQLTPREKDLMFYLGNSIADWVEKHATDRSELLAVFTVFCGVLFSSQTPITDIDKQCEEVDTFCKCIKMRIRDK